MASKTVALACTAAGMFAATAPSAEAQARAAIIIQSDRGGLIAQRNERIRGYRAAGQRIELRGTCLSACTMYLSLPNACVASNATFGFHGPTRNGRSLPPQEFDHFSRLMADNYREPLRSWFMSTARHRTAGYYSLSGAELINMGYRSC